MVVVLLLGLAACGGGSDSASGATPPSTAAAAVTTTTAVVATTVPTTTSTVPPAPTSTEFTAPTSGPLADAFFMVFMRGSSSPPLVFSPEADLISLAHMMCTAMDGGRSVEQIVNSAPDFGLKVVDAAAIVAAGVAAYCPQHQDLVDEYQAR